jgi:hypothetical protein
MKTKLLRKLRKKFKKNVYMECIRISSGEFLYVVRSNHPDDDTPRKYWSEDVDCCCFVNKPQREKICKLCGRYNTSTRCHPTVESAVVHAKCIVDDQIDRYYVRNIRRKNKNTEISNLWKNLKL